MTTKLIHQDQFIQFFTGGNSTFTLKSIKTGNRFTYKVMAADNEPIYFVKLLTGSDNTSDYTDMAMVRSDNGGFPVMTQRPNNKKITKDSMSFKALEFVLYNALVKIPMPNLEIWHEGRCCRCGRKLTVPESIESGIGPECATKQVNSYF